MFRPLTRNARTAPRWPRRRLFHRRKRPRRRLDIRLQTIRRKRRQAIPRSSIRHPTASSPIHRHRRATRRRPKAIRRNSIRRSTRSSIRRKGTRLRPRHHLRHRPPPHRHLRLQRQRSCHHPNSAGRPSQRDFYSADRKRRHPPPGTPHRRRDTDRLPPDLVRLMLSPRPVCRSGW
jgi:hypothetical protein